MRENIWRKIGHDRILVPFQRLVLLSNFSLDFDIEFSKQFNIQYSFSSRSETRVNKSFFLFFLSGGKQIAVGENVIRVKKFRGRYTSIPLSIIAIQVLQWTHCFNASVKCLLVKFVTTR